MTNADDMDKRLINGDFDLDINADRHGQAGPYRPPSRSTRATWTTRAPATSATRSSRRRSSRSTTSHCRKAVIYGADHKSLQTARGGPLAGGDIGTNMLPAVIPGSDPKYDPYGIAKNDGKPDVAKAKAELKACGKPNGFKTTIAVRNNKPVEVATAEALQASLKKVGIDAEVDQFDGAQTSGIIGNPERGQEEELRHHHHGLGPGLPVRPGLRHAAVATASTSCTAATTTTP